MFQPVHARKPPLQLCLYHELIEAFLSAWTFLVWRLSQPLPNVACDHLRLLSLAH